MDVYLICCSGCIIGAAFAPVITTGIGEHVALGIEVGARYGSIDGGESLETLLVIFVPKADDAVSSVGGKRAVGMEGDAVDGVDLVVFAVALEGEGIFASYPLNVMNADTALNASHGKPSCVWKAAPACR